MAKTWFITGASKGFGREWAEAALERRDTVAATARNLGTLETLIDRYGDAVLPLQLDVTDRSTAFDTVKRAAEHFGKLDVVINNAGYGHFGMVEELTEEDVRSMRQYPLEVDPPEQAEDRAAIVCADRGVALEGAVGDGERPVIENSAAGAAGILRQGAAAHGERAFILNASGPGG